MGILFPPRCPVCDELLEQEDSVYEDPARASLLPGVHPGCVKMVPAVRGAVCARCGRPVETETREYCYDCGRSSADRQFIQGKSLFLYQGQMKRMMYKFKYSGRQEYASFFACRAVEEYGGWLEKIGVEAIIPVPMYKGRERRRGYNQAAVFARQLSELTGIPCVPGGVRRIRDTRPMKQLNDVERKNNLKKAFQIQNCVIKYNRVLVVDDIYTTGATLDAVAGVLREAGVDAVYVLSVCIGKGC